METRFWAAVFGAATLLAGCAVQPPSAATASAGATTSAAAPAASTALGAWTPTCSGASTDARALVSNLTAQPGFDGAEPSTVSGFADAAAKAVAPLKNCTAVQVIAVRSDVQVGSDQEATDVVQRQISAMLRTMPLSLTETGVGQAPFGTSLSGVRPALVALLGKPDATYPERCDGGQWSTLQWEGLTVSFDTAKADKPLVNWTLQTTTEYPDNLVPGTWPLTATVAQLQQIEPNVKAVASADEHDVWTAKAAPTMTYVWDGKPTGPSSNAVGGAFQCG